MVCIPEEETENPTILFDGLSIVANFGWFPNGQKLANWHSTVWYLRLTKAMPLLQLFHRMKASSSGLVNILE
jgi:hypothetical protein